MPLVTATFTTGGSVIITEEFELAAITALTTAVSANTLAINTTMGPLGAAMSGNVSASMASQSAMTASIVQALGKIEANQRATIVSIDGIAAKIETNTLAIASLASSLKNIDIMATTIAADQIRNNKFQQKVTNQALVDAGKPPVEIKADEMDQVLTQTLADMKQMSSVQIVYKTVDKATEMLTEGAKWTLEWTARTEVGIFFTRKFAASQALIVGLWAPDKADQIIRDAEAKIVKLRSGVV
jgi:hypothetical protein